MLSLPSALKQRGRQIAGFYLDDLGTPPSALNGGDVFPLRAASYREDMETIRNQRHAPG
jgi:hypothetical protein